MELTPIGVIHSPFATKEACPIQPAYAAEATGSVELYAGFEDGLKDIEGFSHLYLLYRFDRAEEVRLVRATFLDDEPHGVFASRHPCRPNGIGLSIVRLDRREGHILHVRGIDVLDGTPLLDIKPYVAAFDHPAESRSGWMKASDSEIAQRRSDGRFK